MEVADRLWNANNIYKLMWIHILFQLYLLEHWPFLFTIAIGVIILISCTFDIIASLCDGRIALLNQFTWRWKWRSDCYLFINVYTGRIAVRCLRLQKLKRLRKTISSHRKRIFLVYETEIFSTIEKTLVMFNSVYLHYWMAIE